MGFVAKLRFWFKFVLCKWFRKAAGSANTFSYQELKELVQEYAPEQVIELFGFSKIIRLVRNLVYSGEWDEDLYNYAIELLEQLRKECPERWNSDWHYDGMLGHVCQIVLDCDRRYAAYSRAMRKVHPAPPELLVAMSACSSAPGKPPMTEEESIALLKQAVQVGPYVEAVEFLIGAYRCSENTKEQKYWEAVLEQIGDNGLKLPRLDEVPERDR